MTPLRYYAPDGVMTPRKLLLSATLLSLLLAAALLAACGGGDRPGTARPGQLTDPHSVPTASPWQEPPPVIILEPGAITPLSGVGGPEPQENGEPGGGNGGAVAPEECGKTYKVKAGDVPSSIAEKCGVSLQALLDANPGIEPTNLHIGDELNIPQ